MADKEQLAITKIHEIINWLAQNTSTQDINGIGVKLNELAIWAANFASQVSDAHAFMNETEHTYKVRVAEFIKDNGQERGQGAKAEREAEIKYEGLRKESVGYKNLYKRLALKLESIDRILDTFKQRVSALKQLELKNL